MANSTLSIFCSVYLLLGLSNSLQVLVLTEALARGLEKNPEDYRKFIPEILDMANLVERLGWPILLAHFTLFWPLYLRQMLIGWGYLLIRVLRFVLLMGS